jgi:hypothetical protein
VSWLISLHSQLTCSLFMRHGMGGRRKKWGISCVLIACWFMNKNEYSYVCL